MLTSVSAKPTNWGLFFAGLLLLVFCLLVTGNNRAAADPVTSSSGSYSITMTPPSTQLTAPPGGTTTGQFTIINEGSNPYNASLSTAPYFVVGDNYLPKFTLLPGKTDASTWIHFDSSTTQYMPAELPQTISYSLHVPAGTAPGGYYAVIFAKTEPPVANSGVTALNRVGDVLYITVEGPVLKQGSVAAIHLPHIALDTNLPIGLLVKDAGGVHFLTTVNLTAKNEFGNKTPFTASLQRYVLPQTQRLVTSTWSSLPALGIYKISRTATVFGTTKSLPVQTVIVIRPWLLVILVIAVIALVILVIQQLKKLMSKSKGKRTSRHSRR